MVPDIPSQRLFAAHTERMRALATMTSAVLWYTSADGAVAEDNPSWAAFTGQDRAHYEGWGWLDAIHPDDRALVGELWRHAASSGGAAAFSYRLRRHDGAYRQMEAQGARVLNAQADAGWVGICVDVTDNLQAQADLRRSEERLRLLDLVGQSTRALTDATEVMAVTARLLGQHLGASRCAYADVEADSNAFTIRSDWSAPGVPSSAGSYSLDLFGPQATSQLRRGEHLVVHDVDAELGEHGGARMFNAIGIKAIICAGLVKQGRLVAMMAVHQSTPRRWSDADVAIVEEIVDRCWAHIERVRDAAILREQDRRKDDFLATLAHELRNPLAPVRYALALISPSADAARVNRARDVIDRQVRHLARLIDDLLDLARINRGQIPLRLTAVSLADAARRAVEIAQPAIEAARHELVLELPATPVHVSADLERVVQMLGNLLTNAAKYTPPGGRVTLAVDAANEVGRVVVSDTGIGIAPRDQTRLFEMFTQLEGAAGLSQGGLGIGLSLARKLAQLQGGEVRVHSEGAGLGSAFTIELPLAASDDGHAAAGKIGVPS
ncbi:MAG TPA: ATP-binding protein [Ramlibacter sp.]|nr:ATP-binding protein [Ramlibacter sp.]